VVSETRLGDPVVDALDRMSQRLGIRDLDWVVQAIRIQQTVGGRLADVLHTLADFIRAREEVRREVQVLTAEGRASAYVLSALAPFMFLAIQIINPTYLDPMYHGWGLVVLAATGTFMVLGGAIIFRMVKIEV
jgi:tight adherence protein B